MTLTISDFLKGRIGQKFQPSPIIQLWEITIPDGTYQRFVDYFDERPEGGGDPGEISFNGETFQGVEIVRGDIEQRSDGGATQLTLSIYDPLHEVAYFLAAQDGLRDETATLWITTLDHLSTPEDALSARFRIVSSFVSPDPPSATLVLGHYNLYEARFPRIFYDRRLCPNAYHNRHDPTAVGRFCTYPSNEFGASTEQDLTLSAEYAEKTRLFGWSTQQAARASVFSVHGESDGNLRIRSEDPYQNWENQFRHGPYFYRYISGDFDVETLVQNLATDRDAWEVGFVFQDTTEAAPDPEEENPPAAPVSSWLFLGVRDDGASGRELFWRKTVDDVSTAGTTSSTDLYLRATRSGDDFKLYSKAAEGDAWTLRFSQTLTLPTSARVGLAIASGTQASTEYGADFEYLRFNSGGLSTCKQTWEDCQAHDNGHQFNGFREIPNDRARY